MDYIKPRVVTTFMRSQSNTAQRIERGKGGWSKCVLTFVTTNVHAQNDAHTRTRGL